MYVLGQKINSYDYFTCRCYVHAQIFGGSSHVNVSHIIHDLSFGPKYPGIHNPLDGTQRILHDTSGVFKYYIKVYSNILHELARISWVLVNFSRISSDQGGAICVEKSPTGGGIQTRLLGFLAIYLISRVPSSPGKNNGRRSFQPSTDISPRRCCPRTSSP